MASWVQDPFAAELVQPQLLGWLPSPHLGQVELMSPSLCQLVDCPAPEALPAEEQPFQHLVPGVAPAGDRVPEEELAPVLLPQLGSL